MCVSNVRESYQILEDPSCCCWGASSPPTNSCFCHCCYIDFSGGRYSTIGIWGAPFTHPSYISGYEILAQN